MAYLKLQPYQQNSVELRQNLKLSARYYGPYKILEKIGAVAYLMDLPSGYLIHPIFYVSKLKKLVGSNLVAQQQPPACGSDG